MSEVIVADNITAGYDGRRIITGLSFRVGAGEVVAVLGPNGSGKTTLLKAVLGMLPLRQGGVSLFGHKPGTAELEGKVAYIPQRMEFDRTFPITLGEMLSLSRPGAVADHHVEHYIDMLELRGHLQKKVGDLSGGQMQRALLAYALIKEPELLILDEPTSWVDVRGASCTLCIIDELRAKGRSVLIVSHDFSAIKSVCTHVLGVGHEDYFFGRADSPELEKKIAELFVPMHHTAVGASGPYCMHCGEPVEEEER
jgi:ABC-type Mn2+/Zn2+ transport system ATPase subunit